MTKSGERRSQEERKRGYTEGVIEGKRWKTPLQE